MLVALKIKASVTLIRANVNARLVSLANNAKSKNLIASPAWKIIHAALKSKARAQKKENVVVKKTGKVLTAKPLNSTATKTRIPPLYAKTEALVTQKGIVSAKKDSMAEFARNRNLVAH